MRKGALSKFVLSLVLASVILSSLVSPLTSNSAYAQQPQADNQPQVDNGNNGRHSIEDVTKTVGEACSFTKILFFLRLNCIVLDIIWVIDKFLDTTLLNIATYLFDLSLARSLTNISATQFVTIGWGIVRDITNLFFIFILLWIAIATIFDIPGYGAKSILAQLIIAALLVNFSLAIGGFFINFTNALGKAFINPLIDNNCLINNGLGCGISDKLIKFSRVQEISTQQEAPDYVKAVCEKYKGSPDVYKQCINVPGWVTFFDLSQTDRAIQSAIYQALWLIIIIPILSFIFFAGAIFFLVRFLMLSILLVFAPIVFLLFVLPSTRSHWSDWWNRLIQWSFFAPVFLFLLFLTVNTFEQLSIFNVANAPEKDILSISFDMILLITLMVMNLMVAQKMGIMLSGTVIKWGSSMSGWTGRQVRGLAYRGAVRAAAPIAAGLAETGFARTLARTPGFRAITQPAVAIQAERERLDAERAKQIERAAAVSPDLAIARLKGENMGVQAAFAKSANPESMRRLLTKMTPKDQEDYVARLNANKEKYRITDLDKKIGEALSKETNGLAMRVVAKTGVRTTDANFQNEVNNYLDSLDNRELGNALTPQALTSKDGHALEYVLKNLKDESRIGHAVLGTPEKIKSFNDVVTARGGIKALANEMTARGNARGARFLQTSDLINILQGAGVRPFLPERKRKGGKKGGEEEGGEQESEGGGGPKGRGGPGGGGVIPPTERPSVTYTTPPTPPTPPATPPTPPPTPPSPPSPPVTPPGSKGIPPPPPAQPAPSAPRQRGQAIPPLPPPAAGGPAATPKAPAATGEIAVPIAPPPATPEQKRRRTIETAERTIADLERQLRETMTAGKDTEKANKLRNEIDRRTSDLDRFLARGKPEEGRPLPRREAPPLVTEIPPAAAAPRGGAPLAQSAPSLPSQGGRGAGIPPARAGRAEGLSVVENQRAEIERQQRRKEAAERGALRRELRQTRQEIGQARKEIKGIEKAGEETPPSPVEPPPTAPKTPPAPPAEPPMV